MLAQVPPVQGRWWEGPQPIPVMDGGKTAIDGVNGDGRGGNLSIRPGGGDERDGYYPSSHKTPCGCLWNAVNAVRAAFPIRGADFRPTVPLDAVTRCHQRWAIGGARVVAARSSPTSHRVASSG